MSSQTIEESAVEAVRRFHQEQQGRAPQELRAHLVDDMLIIRSHGVFTETEVRLSDSEDGRRLIRSARRDQRALTRRTAEAAVSVAIGTPVLRSFFDLDVRTGDMIEVYILASSQA
jgi:uncharacterized protein YbcI